MTKPNCGICARQSPFDKASSTPHKHRGTKPAKAKKHKIGCPNCGHRYVDIDVVERFRVPSEFDDDGKLRYPDTSRGGDQEYESVFCQECSTQIENYELEES